MDGVTRRQVIVSSAAGAAVFALPVVRATPASAGTGTAPLAASTWLALVGESVRAEGARLEVVSVTGVEDAFSVLFACAESMPSERPISVSHPSFGEATLFLAGIGRPEDGRCELVVDRTVQLVNFTAPAPEPPGAPAVAASTANSGLTAAEQAEVRRFAFLRSVRIGRRLGRRVVRLELRRDAAVRRVVVRVVRDGRVLASGRAVVADDVAEVLLELRGAPPRGRCELIVTAVATGNRRTTVRRLVAL